MRVVGSILAHMKRKTILIIIGLFILLVLVVLGVVAWQRGLLSPASADHPTQFVQHDFVDIAKIGSISKFRSGIGHDFSNGGETCRSMKHYYTPAFTSADMQQLSNQPKKQGKQLPPAPTPDTAVAIYAPVDGRIADIKSEHFPVGEQIFITPDKAKGYSIRLFHVYPVDGIKKGSHVTAGQHIGNISRLSETDISVQAGQINGRYISYFDVMPDSIFASYKELGIKDRSELIFSKEYRDANPFTCNGEQFTQQREGGDQTVTLNGWTDPRMQQGQNPDQRQGQNPDQGQGQNPDQGQDQGQGTGPTDRQLR